MAKNKLQKRSERSQDLRVFQVEQDTFYVESSEGKICYRVFLDDDNVNCTCGDFSRNSKTNPEFKCKHILAVYNTVANGNTEAATALKKKMPKLDDRFIMTLEGKEFVKYPGLLDLGHQKGLSTIEVSIVQLPNADNGNLAVCQATVIAKNGDTYIDIGDASPQNCNSKVARHLLRMASTRAIARALRSYTNIGMTCLEELGDLEEVGVGNDAKTKKPANKNSNKVKKAQPAAQKANGKAPQAEKTPEQQAESQAENQAKDQGKPADQKSGQTQAKRSQKPANTKAPDNNNTAGTDNKEAGIENRESMSTAQKSAIYNLARRRSISQDELEKIAEETFGVSVDYLSRQEASSFIRHLQQAA